MRGTLSWPVVFAFMFLLACWGYSWIFLKIGLGDCGPLTFAALRTVIAGVFLIVMLPVFKRPVKPVRLKETALLGLIQTALFVGLSQWSLVTGAVGKTSILVFTMPFWVLLFAWLMVRERLIGLQWLAAIVAALGLLLVLTPWRLTGSIESQYFALAAGAAWGLSTVLAKKIQSRDPIDLINLTAWQMLIGSMVLSAIAFLAGERPINWSTQFIFALLFTGFVSTGIGWLLWLYLLRHLAAGVASMSMLAVPVIAILAAAFHLGERPPTVELAGMGLILFALLVLSLATWHNNRPIAGEMAQE